jgi:hypothetical protein
MRIAFFGASVTDQTGECGYVDEFKKLTTHTVGVNVDINTKSSELDIKIPQYDIKAFGYNGLQIHTAGVCMIDTVLTHRPNICFIEWFTPHMIPDDNTLYASFDTMICKFTKAQCQLVFLILPRKDYNPNLEKLYTKVTEYGNKFAIKTISLSNVFPNIDDLLYDVVHTNKDGAKLYTKYIYEEFKRIEGEIKLVSNPPPTNKYVNVKTFNLNQVIEKELNFTLNGELIGLYLLLDYAAPQVTVETKEEKKVISIWDNWVYPGRFGIKLNFVSKGKEDFKVTIIEDDNIDRSGALYPKEHKETVDWKSIKKIMNIKKIFYIGEITINSFE